ncbi:MAG TPA: hypothetical protein VFA18_06780 [Gemmataceae bacterium]|nr:hypothetical protein [Gemmataceae bacterium]
MRRKRFARLGGVLLLLTPILLLTGCRGGGGGGGGPDLDPAKKHILNALHLYTAYSTAHGKAPKTMDEVKKWAKGLNETERKKYSVTDVSDDVFVSPRDHKEYAIKPDKRTGRARMGPNPLVIYEEDGSGGTRLGAGQQGNVMDMNEEIFQKQMSL